MSKYFRAVALMMVIAFACYSFGQAGVSTTVGGVAATNQFNPTTAATTTTASVTNPASNFLIQVLGGPIYFNGNTQFITQATLQLAANQTYLVVWSGFTEQLYAKQAVTGPGSPSASSGASLNSPGVPTALLFADPTKGEIPLATVVCNATACGNGGNGSITDNRAISQFPAGQSLQGVTFANLPASPDGLMLMCAGCTQPTTGSITCTTGAANVLAMRTGGAWRCYLRDPEETELGY